ncbi:related to Ubiquitin carboxyl-terminal hydrolase 14 [Saccharomycodes ludwigii]|uniref:Ubiquitin carboxyl-terminal hydrolase n=1 Tax=Saccharomycodes ludwigii TaxID=36035 RepID=A0A376B530_9ASCO|nr:hypothetical protein SCDLUD_003695 [Saccharomycodes ludwigii]KAH3900695.1 hypothetical protein SCDLUD_003695 [Saccharomycodes ludwigii]SSD59763.1 related to Ubiquitin carboxyl-terminal hydrolase 14 [Saccharomycodes ludwigii]
MTSSIELFINNISLPSTIYKDDCAYCYRSMYNDVKEKKENLSLCLHCFQSFCGSHVSFHHDKVIPEHKNYLELAKFKKSEKELEDRELDQEDETGSFNKKIKLEIKESLTEDQLYDTKWSVYELNSNAGGNITKNYFSCITNESCNNEDVKHKINALLTAKSSSFQEMSDGWTQEFKTCSHIREIEDYYRTTYNNETNEKSHKLLSTFKCSDCDLNDNLWVCLTCGNIGCGRQQIGLEGHSHALKHNEVSRHPVAMKLGSLSENTRDIYCYSCDDEVKFSDSFVNNKKEFSEYCLKVLGIDLNVFKPTEKSLVELNVEQNMNWDFQMKDSEGNDLTQLESDTTVGCGLINLGNSCYLNSVIQCLFNGGVHKDWKLGINEFPPDVVFANTNFKCQVLKLWNALNLTPSLYPRGVKPTLFKKVVGGSHEEFSSGRQQDAMEYFTYLIDTLDKKLYRSLDTFSPNDIFRFKTQDKLKCTKCLSVKLLDELQECVQVPLQENVDKQDLSSRLDEVFSSNDLNDFTCSKCKGNNCIIKKTYVATFPKTLVVNPTRIKLVDWQPVKTSSELEIPEVIDLSKYRIQPLSANETLIDDDDDEDDQDASFTPNFEVLNNLKEMGFSENACLRALFNTNNTNDSETIVNWLFQHVEDSDLNEPFEVPKKNSKTVLTGIDEISLNNMISMGLPLKLCQKALIVNNGNVNNAVEWVFNNMDDDGELQEVVNEQQSKTQRDFGDKDPNNSVYKLKGVICHKGNSVHSGHYVAFIRRCFKDEKEKWVLYNDEKIVIADDPVNFEEIKKNGYIFFYNRD